MLSAVVLALLGAASAFAQTESVEAYVDLRPDNELRLPIGGPFTFNLTAGWAYGPADDVILDIDLPGAFVSVTTRTDGTIECTKDLPMRCRISARDETYSADISIKTLQTRVGKLAASATIHTSTFDYDPDDNRDALTVYVADRPALFAGGYVTRRRSEPNETNSGQAFVYNLGVNATHATLTLTLPDGGAFTDAKVSYPNVPATCNVDPSEVVCVAEHLDFQQGLTADVTFTAPDRLDGGPLRLHMSAASNEGISEFSESDRDVEMKLIEHLLVTNTADEGTGSLRQALIEARTRCATDLCTVDFRIPPPVPEGGWFTIRPASPLPEVFGPLKIDGATQTRFGGDTNKDGPEIEIDGSQLDAGHGFAFRDSCEAHVLDLAIHGFPGHAIDVQGGKCGGSAIIQGNYLGTDARGLTAIPNERGVVISNGTSVSIDENLISGNRRAGIFIGKALYARVDGNRIGVNAKGEPLGNGASGVFLDVAGSIFYTWGADVEDNVIAYNGEWGVCRTPGGAVIVTRNSIHDNLVSGIDIGLDFETPNHRDDTFTFPNKPLLTSATYDPVTQTTIVRGRLDSDGVPGTGPGFTIDLYASSGLSVWGYPQGEEMVAFQRVSGHADFEIVIARDLRGKLITATNTRRHILAFSHQSPSPGETSEFSNVIEVLP